MLSILDADWVVIFLTIDVLKVKVATDLSVNAFLNYNFIVKHKIGTYIKSKITKNYNVTWK